MKGWESLRHCIPAPWLMSLEVLTCAEKKDIQELRLRIDQPVTVSMGRGLRYLCRGGITALRQPDVWICTREQLAYCVSQMCEESLYAYEEQLRQGFLTLPGGIRVGVAGRARVEDGHICCVQDITALCIRLPRWHAGCAVPLLPYLEYRGGLYSSLLVGEPASGKTSLLRDAAVQLASRGYRVTVVDERGELSGVGELPGCDVLLGYPKAIGIRQAVRCLAPQVVLFDELGEEAEVQAIAACAHAGVAVIASLHGRDCREVACLPTVRLLAERQIFRHWLFLRGRQAPGQVHTCLRPEVRGYALHWITADRSGGDRSGAVCFPSLRPAGEKPTTVGATVGKPLAAAELFRSADGTDLAAVGGG